MNNVFSDGRDAISLGIVTTDAKKVKDIPAANSPSHRDAVHRLSGNSFDFYIKIKI